MNEKYLKILELLAEQIIAKEVDNSMLKYENTKLKEKIEKLEGSKNFF